ncbi:MAG: hypothetical protein NTU44_01855 [Bacteroidetes bacterium]|nr:hypothetical protein [Bacteroidota bacterium]
MRILFLFLLSIFAGICLHAQPLPGILEGTVSYVTPQNVYVKFSSTENLTAGDTLYVKQGDKLLPSLVIRELSSTSCVCLPLSLVKPAVSDRIVAKVKPEAKQEEKATPSTSANDQKPPTQVEKRSQEKQEKTIQGPLQQRVTGRLSIGSYSNLSNTPAGNYQRMRYTLALEAKNLGNSKLSAESYICFVHSDKQWEQVKSNIFNGLKIYSLALNYVFSPNLLLWFGRKINPRMSNAGAIDGLQLEFRSNSITTGIITGFRPDLNDYSVNTKLMQFGGYIGHDYTFKNRSMQSTLALVEQQNSGKTDRRFSYFQHSNSLVRNLYFFGSIEVDLYKKVAEKQDNSPRLTNTYLSLRYKVSNQLSLSTSYSARENIIYYESYKTLVERLLETINQQGYMFQFNYQPFRKISLGATTGYRTQKNDPKPSKNLYAFLTCNQLPGINVSATLSATLLETSYLKGNIYSLGFSKDLIAGKLFSEVAYRYVDYHYFFSEENLPQHMGELNLTWRIVKKLSLSLFAEGTFEKQYRYNQLYLSVSRRF